MNKTQKKEEVIQEVLRLLEKGESESHILQTYPTFRKEILTLFENIHMLEGQKTIIPPQALLQSALDKLSIDRVSIQSPYQNSANLGWFAVHKAFLQRLSLSTIAIVMLIVGGVFYNQYQSGISAGGGSGDTVAQAPESQDIGNTTLSSPTDTSDAALEQDLNAVDNEMNGLNMDNNNIDQTLGS